MKRSAFSLVELLVVIAIIAVLIGLLMPAVQKVREGGNRTRCLNNMRQLGVGLQQHEGQYRLYPYASTTSANTGEPKTSHGTMIWLLQFVDQGAIFSKYNLAVNWNNAANTALINTPLPLLQCPSNPRPGQTASGHAISDYAASTSVILGTQAYDSNAIPFNYGGSKGTALGSNLGLLQTNARCRNEDVRDGASNTIALFEDAGRPLAFNSKRQLIPGTISGAAWADQAAAIALHGFNDAGDLTSEGEGICGMNCTNNNEIYSFHIGGAVFAMADGSTRVLGRPVPIAVLAALTTRAGGGQEASAIANWDQ